MATDAIQFSSRRLDSFQIYYADGIWGGLVPDGLVMNFYVDWRKEPNAVIISDDPETEIPGQNDFKTFERLFQCGIKVRIDTARALREWLDTMITDYDEAAGKPQEKENG